MCSASLCERRHKAEDFIQAKLNPTGASGALLAAINYLDNTNATAKFDRQAIRFMRPVW